MELRTEIKINKYPFGLDYSTKTMWLGSCFANNMGKCMEVLHFPTLVNPFGAIFNPASLTNNIDILLNKTFLTDSDIFAHNDIYNSFPFHSQFSDTDKASYLANVNEQIEKASKFLSETDVLFITLGTSYMYVHKDTNQVVNNCHKLPAKSFSRRMLSVAETTELLTNTVDSLYLQNSNLKIVFSISPIRHLSDGAHENQLSKSSLLIAVDNVCKSSNCLYFPSYEIMLDDLRDYRFYDEDMCHPNKLAQNYIWEKFADAFISKSTQGIIDEIILLNKALNHRPINPNSESHTKFMKSTMQKLSQLENKYPFLAGKLIL